MCDGIVLVQRLFEFVEAHYIQYRREGLALHDRPIVVRLDGNNVLEGRRILNEAAHPLVQQLDTMDGAAAKAAELAAK